MSSQTMFTQYHLAIRIAVCHGQTPQGVKEGPQLEESPSMLKSMEAMRVTSAAEA